MARRVLLLLVLTSLLLTACGGDSPTPTPTPAATPTAASAATATVPTPADAAPTATGIEIGAGTISGKASYANGEPLSDVTVVIRGTTMAGSNTYFEAKVDTEGRYTQKVPNGLYEIKAHVSAPYKGRTYGLWLDPADGIDTPGQDSAPGIIKDFVWRISGPTPAATSKPDSPFSYYGGIVEVGNDSEFEMQYNNGNLVDPYDYPANSRIRVTLTPDGPLMDGSTGTVVERDIDPQELTDAILYDIPLGDYTVTATLVDQGGEETDLQVATIIPGGEIGAEVTPAESAPAVFMPEAFGSFGFQALKLYILPAE